MMIIFVPYVWKIIVKLVDSIVNIDSVMTVLIIGLVYVIEIIILLIVQYVEIILIGQNF